jgi:Cd2+/Zn2+-exporting ATPase
MYSPISSILAAFLFWASLGAPSFAGSHLLAACRTGEIETRIAGCTEVISRGKRETKQNQLFAYIGRAAAYRAKGDFDRALADLDKALRLSPKSAPALLERGSIYRDRGDFDRAIADYSAAISAQPRSATAFFGRAESYRAKNNLDSAIADYDVALRLDKSLAMARRGRAAAYRDKGDLDRALADFDAALTLDPKSAPTHVLRGAIYHSKGNLDRAIADYDKAIELDPRYASAFVERANAFRDKHELERAKQDLEVALKLNPRLGPAKVALDELNRILAAGGAPPGVATPPAPAPAAPPIATRLILVAAGLALIAFVVGGFWYKGARGNRAQPTSKEPARAGRHTFKVTGLDCAEEVAVLRREVGPLVGGEEHLAFDVLNGRMIVLDTARPISPDAIINAVRRTGMTAEEWRLEGREPSDASERRRRQQVWFTILSGLFVAAGFVIHIWLAGGFGEALRLLGGHDGKPMPLPEAAAYALAVVFGVRFVIVKAWYAALGLRPDMNLLMVIAVAGAVAIGEWFEAATVSFLFALSLTLESWSVARARHAISALLDLAPPTVRLLRSDGSEADAPAAEIRPGDRFVVRGGERIALDGRVVTGVSAVNQAPITGESVPVEKAPGAEVFAGTINGDGALTVEATRAAENTMLARIVRMVEEAHARRAPSEQWVEQFARIYTPSVMVFAIVVFLGPPLAFGGAWNDWFYRALVLLVIACPCALVISTPVSIVAALASSARAGVLVKGGAYLELPARLKAVAMDKTGTITRGEPEVVRVVPFGTHTDAELLARAAALESRSTHPLARAILHKAQERVGVIAPATEVQALKGKGLTGMVDGEPFWLGSHRYVVERGQDTSQSAELAEALEGDGKTVIVVGNARHVCGLIAVADTIRPEAGEIVRQLHAAGVSHIVMLTGDNRVTAEAIAREVGVDEVYAELLPEDKVKKIDELVERYGVVAMVGDGVNDAPALARASLGVAMGAIGSDAAIETADVALMTDDISKLPWLVRHAKRTLAIIRQNIAFSLGVKAIFMALTFAGLATLWGAIAADVGASLVVIANALRLLRSTPVPNTGSRP